MRPSRLLAIVLVVPALTFFLRLAAPELSGSFVEGDLASYFLGAQRLIETGSPYQAVYRDLSALVPFWLDWQVYIYSPLMAQLFTGLFGLGFTGAWAVWFALSAAALGLAGLLAWRAGGGRITVFGAIVGALLLLGVTPVTAGIVTGRPEPLIALAIAIALVSDRAAPALAFVTLLRLTPAPLLLPYALATGRPARTVVAFALSGVAMLAVAWIAAPVAWSEFVFGGVGAYIGAMTTRPEVLASLSGAPAPALYLALSDFMLDPALPVSERLAALLAPLRIATLFGSLLLLGLSLRWARTRARRHASLGAAALATIVVGGTVWDYHLVPLVPIALAAWAAGGRWARSMLVLAVVIASLVPLELLRSGGVFPTWWNLIALPIGLCVVEAARSSRLPSRAD
jgi:hypothetical protein